MDHGKWLQGQAEEAWGMTLTPLQLEQFAKYYEGLIEKNQVMNLTRITEIHEVYIKHFWDSLSVLSAVDLTQAKTLIDVGTGAGFPGIPLAIIHPHLEVTLLDSHNKRVVFLQEMAAKLGLDNVYAMHGRAEHAAHQKRLREAFDVVTARAVAKLNVLAEYTLPFAKVAGVVIAMKGGGVKEEIQEAERALHILGKCQVNPICFALPEEKGQRCLIVMKKRDHSPNVYPRRPGIPDQKPLS